MHRVPQHKHYGFRSTAAFIHTFKGAVIALAVTAFFFICAPPTNAQQPGFFDVKSVIQDVQKRFHLNQADLQFVGPLIQQDNSDLLVIYQRYGGTEPQYSNVMWRQVIDQRTNFETRANKKMTGRQASALRVARRALETRILGRIVEDYVDFLVVYLELEALEIEAVEHLLQKEKRTKHQLVLKYLNRPEVLEKELEGVTARTEYWLSRILSPEQMRLYQALSDPGESVVA